MRRTLKALDALHENMMGEAQRARNEGQVQASWAMASAAGCLARFMEGLKEEEKAPPPVPSKNYMRDIVLSLTKAAGTYAVANATLQALKVQMPSSTAWQLAELERVKDAAQSDIIRTAGALHMDGSLVIDVLQHVDVTK